MCLSCSILISIFLFLKSNVNRTTRNPPPVFVYLCKLLVVPCAFCLNINGIYLFTYSNQCQQNHTQATTCIYLFMQITCCSMCLSNEYSVSVCLLIQINVNKSRCKRPPVFVYLCKLPVVSMCLSFEYSYLFVYFFKLMSTKTCAPLQLDLFRNQIQNWTRST